MMATVGVCFSFVERVGYLVPRAQHHRAQHWRARVGHVRAVRDRRHVARHRHLQLHQQAGAGRVLRLRDFLLGVVAQAGQ